MPTGLIRRGGRYSLRRRIPLELVQHYGGRTEIVRALGTADPKEARRLHWLAWAALTEEFDQATAQVVKSEAPTAPKPLDPLLLSARILASLRSRRDEAAAKNTLGDFMEYQREQLAYQQYVIDGVEPPTNSLTSHEAHRSAIRALLTGDGFATLEAARSTPIPIKTTGGATKGDSLMSVVDRWSAENKPKDRTLTRTRNIVDRFEAVNGKLTVQAITKQHVLAFKDALIAEGQSPANINVLIPMLGTVLNYAIDKLYLIEINPAAKVRVTDKRKAKDKRRAFEVDELNAIFASPIYSKGLRPTAGGGNAAYWLPILALYTGARQTELGQLHPDDVLQEMYRDADGQEQSAWVIRIIENLERGQQVKNEGSERRIPLHATLIDLGFLLLVQTAKAQGRARIFHRIAPNSTGELMGNWSKWFARYRRAQCGLKGKDTPFHSFRHSFKHFARLASIPADVHNELTGHETGDVADAYGGLSYPLLPLVDAIARYRVPGLNIPAAPAG